MMNWRMPKAGSLQLAKRLELSAVELSVGMEFESETMVQAADCKSAVRNSSESVVQRFVAAQGSGQLDRQESVFEQVPDK